MDFVRVISDGMRTGDFLWSLPLVAALGANGPRKSVHWVELCLHRMVDLAGIRLRNASIHDRIAGASDAAVARDLKEVRTIVEAAGLKGDPVVDAITMLYTAYWQVAHRDDNQFALSQESVFSRIRNYWSEDGWDEIIELATEEFSSALAIPPDTELGTTVDWPEY